MKPREPVRLVEVAARDGLQNEPFRDVRCESCQ